MRKKWYQKSLRTGLVNIFAPRLTLQCTMCSLGIFTSQPTKLYFDISFNKYLSQLFRLQGECIFLNFSKNIPHCHTYNLQCQTLGYIGHWGIVLYKVHIVQWSKFAQWRKVGQWSVSEGNAVGTSVPVPVCQCTNAPVCHSTSVSQCAFVCPCALGRNFHCAVCIQCTSAALAVHQCHSAPVSSWHQLTSAPVHQCASVPQCISEPVCQCWHQCASHPTQMQPAPRPPIPMQNIIIINIISSQRRLIAKHIFRRKHDFWATFVQIHFWKI